MNEYSYYYAMPYEEAKRFTRLEANRATLQTIRRYLGYSLEVVLTDDERQACEAIIDTALARVSTGLAEFDGYKRPEPLLVEDYGVR